MKTKMQAGKLIAAYVDDPMGRRVILAKPDPSHIDGRTLAAVDPIQIGTTRAEVYEVARVLRELAQELPETEPAPGVAPACPHRTLANKTAFGCATCDS